MTPHERYVRALRDAADAAAEAASLTFAPVAPIEPPSTGGVYFAMANDRVKIGKAKNVAARLRELQTSAPYRIDLLAVAPGGLKEESRYHAMFRHLRVQGEWFATASDLMSTIAALQKES